MRLIKREASVVQCRLYGTEGQRQKGIDIYARADAGEVRVYQCKKVRAFGGYILKKAVEDFLKDEWASQSKCFVVCTSSSGASTSVVDELLRSLEKLSTCGIELKLWDLEEISERLKGHPDLVHDFFGKQLLEVFLGKDVAERFSERLTPDDVVRFRTRLLNFYSAVFSEQDQAIPIPTEPGVSRVPLLDRFVLPDILLERDIRVTKDAGEQTFSSNRVDKDQRRVIDKRPAPENRSDPSAPAGRQPLGPWMERSTNSLVVGGPGSGKSALLRGITLDLLSERPRLSSVSSHWGSMLPVFIPFAFWTQEIARQNAPCGVAEGLRRWLVSWSAEDCWPLVNKALSDERLLILVDGLDEWTSKEAASSALQVLQVFIDTKHIRVLASSRPDMVDSIRGSNWQIGTLAPFNLEQQTALARVWFDYRYKLDNQNKQNDVLVTEETRRFLHEIESSSDLIEVARVPLLLLLLLYLRFQNAVLPTGRFEAYAKVVDYLTESHLPQKRSSALVNTALKTVLRNREIRSLLGFVASNMQESKTNGVIDRSALEELVEDYLTSPSGAGLHLETVQLRTEVDAFIDQIALASGLMVRQGSLSLSFLHRSIQEFLAGVHLAALTPEEQRRVLEQRWRIRGWKETILSLFSRLERQAETSELLLYLKSQIGDTPDGMYARELASEIAFGNFYCPAPLAREIAEDAFTAIETHEWSPHRIRLVRRVLSGLRSLRTHDLVQSKVAEWVYHRALGPWFEALSDWSPTPELFAALFEGLYSEDIQAQKSAARVLAQVGGNDPSVRDRLVTIAEASLLPDRRAAALIGLSIGWPEDNSVRRLVEGYRTAPSPTLKVAALISAVNCSIHNESDLNSLLRLNNERYQDTPGYFWTGETVDALVKGWSGNQILKEACSASIREHFRHSGQLDKDIAERVFLQAFPGDAEVVVFAVSELKNQHPFLSLHFDAFRYLGQHFSESPELSIALDEWAIKQEFREPEIALSAPVGRTQVRKHKLIESLSKSHPFWAAESLLKNWGMQDTEVASALLSMALGPAGPASAIGKSIPTILGDSGEALERLLTLLDDPDCSWHHWVMQGIASLNPSIERAEIVERAMNIRGRTHPANLDMLDDAIISGFGDVPSVRSFAQKALMQRNPRLWSVARTYGDNAEMRSSILRLTNPLPAFLRLEVVDSLMSVSDDAFVRDLLRSYDVENNDEAKTLASIAYHRAILHHDSSDELALLEQNIQCYGHDYEDRRRAAFAGLLVLRRLDLMLKNEHLGSNIPIAISLEEMRRVNNALLNLIGDQFDYVERTLGDSLRVRLSGHPGGSSNPFALLASVAYGRPALEQTIWDEIARDPTYARQLHVLKFLSVHRSGSRFLKDTCIKALTSEGYDLDRHEQIYTAVDIIADQYAPDSELMQEILALYPDGHLRHCQIVALCAGWPSSEVVGHCYAYALEDGIQSVGPDAYYAIIFSRCPEQTLVEHLSKAIEHVARRPMFADKLVWSILRRLRRDDGARQNLAESLETSEDVEMKTNLLALLAQSGGLTHSQTLLAAQELSRERGRPDGSRVAFDLMSGQYQSVIVGL
ncbi:MAG: NACHT domain-containing protein, partial [Acidobacteriota bacterium]|nr:NACHT domain-containing protein [Acidobacteriota bacterium]